jgi:hypothetical protein
MQDIGRTAGIYSTCCAILTNIVCFAGDGKRSLQDVLQTCGFVAATFSRKSAIFAASHLLSPCCPLNFKFFHP